MCQEDNRRLMDGWGHGGRKKQIPRVARDDKGGSRVAARRRFGVRRPARREREKSRSLALLGMTRGGSRVAARRHFGVRRLAAAFTVDTVAPHESLERDGLHRKSGSKLPHSKAPQEHRQECLCHKARDTNHESRKRKSRSLALLGMTKGGETRVTGHETRVTRRTTGRGR